MNPVNPPATDHTVSIEIKNLPVRLWWKLMETAQQRGVKVSYLVFQILVDALGYDEDKEPYDMVVKEIEEALKE